MPIKTQRVSFLRTRETLAKNFGKARGKGVSLQESSLESARRCRVNFGGRRPFVAKNRLGGRDDHTLQVKATTSKTGWGLGGKRGTRKKETLDRSKEGGTSEKGRFAPSQVKKSPKCGRVFTVWERNT